MNKFCVIGLGDHARTKIIPAIKNLKDATIAVVTRKKDFKDKNILIFNNIDQAIDELDKDFIFYISTPPSTHYKLAKVLLENNFNCLIEKPIFLNTNEFLDIKKVASNNSKNFCECFMYRYGKIYSEFMNIYNRNKEEIKSLEIKFCIPKVPPNTFRSSEAISSSMIYDIGCYPISLINDLAQTKEIDIDKINNYGNYKKEKFNIKGRIDDINLNITFGVAPDYENYVLIHLNDNYQIKFEYFFYGRKTEKKITTYKNKIEEIKVINDRNLFEEMLKKVSYNLSSKQEIMNIEIQRNILDIELLISNYKKYNRHAPK